MKGICHKLSAVLLNVKTVYQSAYSWHDTSGVTSDALKTPRANVVTKTKKAA